MWKSTNADENGAWRSDFKWKWMENREHGHHHEHDSIAPLIATLIQTNIPTSAPKTYLSRKSEQYTDNHKLKEHSKLFITMHQKASI